MRTIVVILACAFALQVAATSTVAAAPTKVLVLPLDGNVDPAVRARLNLSVVKLARTIQGDVTVGDATFDETATAIGCGATSPTCAETVRATLGVDELVYGSVSSTPSGQVELVVHRVKARSAPRTSRIVVAADAPPEEIEAALTPRFAATTARPRTTPVQPTDPRAPDAPLGQGDSLDPGQPIGPATPTGPIGPIGPTEPAHDDRARTRGVIITSAGGLSVLIGLLLWSNKSEVQGEIDRAPTVTETDFDRLEELERRAWRYAMFGNVMVLGGLAVAGYGGWTLYKDQQARKLVVTPEVTPAGAGVMLRGTW